MMYWNKIRLYARAIGLTVVGTLGYAFGAMLLVVVALIGFASLFDKTNEVSLKNKLVWLFGGSSGFGMLCAGAVHFYEIVLDAWIDALSDNSDELVIESKMEGFAE